MTNVLDCNPQKHLKQKPSFSQNIKALTFGVCTLVLSIIGADNTQAAEIVLQVQNPKYNPYSKEVFARNREVLKRAWLTVDQIIAVEKIIIRDIANKKEGKISDRALIEVNWSWYQSSYPKEENVNIPEKITKLNFGQIVDILFNQAQFKAILEKEKISQRQKDSLVVQIEQDRLEMISIFSSAEAKYWPWFIGDWFNLYNKLSTKIKNKWMTIMGELLKDTYKLIEIRYDKIGKNWIEKNKLEREEIDMAMKIYATIHKKIDCAMVSYMIRWKMTEHYFIVWKDVLSFLWISTNHTIKVAQDAYEIYYNLSKETKKEDLFSENHFFRY